MDVEIARKVVAINFDFGLRTQKTCPNTRTATQRTSGCVERLIKIPNAVTIVINADSGKIVVIIQGNIVKTARKTLSFCQN